MSKDLDVNKLMDSVKALSVENENLLSENEKYKAEVAKLESEIKEYKRSCDDLYKDKHKVEVDLAAERDKANAYQRENEMLIQKIDSRGTVKTLVKRWR